MGCTYSRAGPACCVMHVNKNPLVEGVGRLHSGMLDAESAASVFSNLCEIAFKRQYKGIQDAIILIFCPHTDVYLKHCTLSIFPGFVEKKQNNKPQACH